MPIRVEAQTSLFAADAATAADDGEAQRRAARRMARHYIALAASAEAAAWTEAQRRAATQVVHNATRWLAPEERDALRAEFASATGSAGPTPATGPSG